MQKWALALFLGFVTLFATATALAEGRRIAVLGPDDELLRALVLALSPWGVEPVRVDAPPPQASPPEAISTALGLAHELNVEAVVWVSNDEQGTLLWVFDAHTGEVTTRLLGQSPPFDSATAAAVALSVKTALRPSLVAPLPPTHAEQPEHRPAPPPPPPPRPVERVFALELGGGGYLLRPGALELRGELAAVYWAFFSRHLGLSVQASTGPDLNIDDASFRGTYGEVEVGGKLRVRPVLGPSFSLTVALGGGAHFTTLEGTLTEESAARTVERVNASIDFDTGASFRVFDAVYLGATLGLAYFPEYRRYLVEGTPIFSPWPVTTSLRGYLGVELF